MTTVRVRKLRRQGRATTVASPRPTFEIGERVIVVSMPIRLVSEMNHREHPFARHSRAQDQKLITTHTLNTKVGRVPPAPPLVVRMVRLIGARGQRFDSDNLVVSCKHVRDAIAKWLGIDDRHDDLVHYTVAQEKSATKWPGVRVEIRRKEAIQ